MPGRRSADRFAHGRDRRCRRRSSHRATESCLVRGAPYSRARSGTLATGTFRCAVLLGLDRSAGPASSPQRAVDLLVDRRRPPPGDMSAHSQRRRPRKSHDDLVARLGGRSFRHPVGGAQRDSATVRCLLNGSSPELQSPMTLGARQVYVSASIGIAVSVTGHTSAEAVLSDAETALYRARVLGGSRSEVFDTAVLRSEQAAVRSRAI